MSATIESRVVESGADDYVDEAWALKEQIRREDGVLRQRRGFFKDAYRRSTVYCYLETGQLEPERLVGFAAVRRDGYILFLAVSEEYRGNGFGKQLIARVADNHSSVTCHARTTNEPAIGFYKHMGFEVQRRIENYYEDGGDAFYLKLGSGGGITDRLSRLLR
ncbi:GNAT family N-acetyltransferase [Halorientalis salina]|uniref:GNAT family N-acetyltransferase n=1 Tax=Halorientalis salina TaxID=2932266 RepID=UPI0010ACCDAB|nr:N-acetyltransferase [Halorientalis salina]